MPWLSNMLLDGLFIAQTPGTPITVTTPDAATPAAVVGTPTAVVGTPDATATTPTPGGATPATAVTPATLQTPVVDPGTATQEPPVRLPSEPYQNGLSGGQWVMLVIFSGVCIGLITCVLFQNSKSDGLGGMMGGGAGGQSTFKGKKSGEEKLSQITTWFATAFIMCSLGMAILFK